MTASPKIVHISEALNRTNFPPRLDLRGTVLSLKRTRNVRSMQGDELCMAELIKTPVPTLLRENVALSVTIVGPTRMIKAVDVPVNRCVCHGKGTERTCASG